MNTPDPSPRPEDPLCGLSPADLLAAGLAGDTQAGAAADAKAPPPPTPEELAPEFPALEIAALIGRGGMGAVYRARQRSLDRWVALKVLRSGLDADVGFAERFAREARALAQLNHPGIVTLYEFGRTPGGLFFILMELVDGVNLRQLLSAGRLSPREALAIVPPLCDALQYAHDRGLVHRDIKPENILVDRLGRVKIADFGIAKAIDVAEHPRVAANPATSNAETPSAEAAAKASASLSGDLTQAGQLMGTPRYMAPEQSERPAAVDHRADLYALGVVFYQMLTGELPAAGQLEPPSRKVTLDVRLDAIVLRALERDPERRYAAANELKTQVETVAHTPPTMSAARSASAGNAGNERSADAPRKGGRPRSLWAMSLVSLLFTLLALGLAVYALRKGEGARVENPPLFFFGLGWMALELGAIIGVLRLRPFWRKVMLGLVVASAVVLATELAWSAWRLAREVGIDAPLSGGLMAWVLQALFIVGAAVLQGLWLRWKWKVLRREDVRALFAAAPARASLGPEWAVVALVLCAMGALAISFRRPLVQTVPTEMRYTEEQRPALDAVRDKLKADLAERLNAESASKQPSAPEARGDESTLAKSGRPADDVLPQARLISVELDLAAARTRYSTKHPTLIALEQELIALGSRPVSPGDDTFRELLGQRLTLLEGELAALSTRYASKHPLIIEEQARIARARELLALFGGAAPSAKKDAHSSRPGVPTEALAEDNARAELLRCELDLAVERMRHDETHYTAVYLRNKIDLLNRQGVRDARFRELLVNELPKVEARLAELARTRRKDDPALYDQRFRLDRARELLESFDASLNPPAVEAPAPSSASPAAPEPEPARRVVVRSKENPGPASVSVSVLGEVNRAGAYSLSHDGTLLEALAAAGSWRRGADLERVSVLRFMPDGSSTLQEWQNLNAIIEGRVPNMVLGERSVVSVEAGVTSIQSNKPDPTPTRASPAAPNPGQNTSGTVRVAVLGEAIAPGLYVLKEGTTLLEALAAAGGSTRLGDTRKVAVLSGRPGETLVPSHYDLRAIQSGKAADPRLRDRDILVMPERVF